MALSVISICFVAGCASSPEATETAAPAANPAPFHASAYDALFAAAADQVRDFGFTVDRRDYRFGVITSQPKGSPTTLEPWHHDNTTSREAWRSTFNDLRRVVRVSLEPAAEGQTEQYKLRVEVVLEQQQRPTRRLTHTAGSRVFADLKSVPTEYAERGIKASYWEPVGRDPLLETRLLEAIFQTAADAEKQDLTPAAG